jgi:hypothetical protein
VSPAAILVALVERAARVVLERTEGRASLATVESMFARFDGSEMRGLESLNGARRRGKIVLTGLIGVGVDVVLYAVKV